MMRVQAVLTILGAQAVLAAVSGGSSLPGTLSAFTVPAAFPTSVFSSYYVKPNPTVEPQPVIYDPVLNKTFQLNLTDPATVPTSDEDPVYYPQALANLSDASAAAVIEATSAEILKIIYANDTGLTSTCSKCVAALSAAQIAAKLAPSYLPEAMVSLCQTTGFNTNTTCQETYQAGSFGAPWTTIIANADVTGLDGQSICAYLGSYCSWPNITTPYEAVFPKPKPANASRPAPSGERVKVLHLSDLHLDARYEVGSEGNCTSSMCCRHQALLANGSAPAVAMPAPLYGYYKCDSPYYLALAALQSIEPLTGTSKANPAAFTLYTGDLVAHDSQWAKSRAYVEEIEVSVWKLFKEYMGGPVYAALGNHDTNPDNLDIAHAVDNDGPVGEQFSWNYEHVSGLWEYFGWIDSDTAANASTHYGAYSIKHPLGLRIITLNTDFYYRNNMYALINTKNPDFSGMFTFLIEELQKAEDAGERVWIVGHVLSGWDGSNPLPLGTDLFYQIVDRYSPHVIANIFFGHTHEDQLMIYYANNATNASAETALASAWIGPSITPLTNLNSGFRLYEVDTGSWDIYDAYTFYADVSSFSSLDAAESGPVFELEYSTRATYGPQAGWPRDAPLNGTFWHRVTEAMEANHTLVSEFNHLQGKSSVRSPNCTSDACAEAKICYMRSGSVPLGRQCPQGFNSVQSSYTGVNF
ncbi:Metallo-dependent phosphatase-like protein [Xylariales sp. PMI_506]|nr:Metallo-dependent phosphatase-like protein [Xylariales sp. PMI_506]